MRRQHSAENCRQYDIIILTKHHDGSNHHDQLSSKVQFTNDNYRQSKIILNPISPNTTIQTTHALLPLKLFILESIESRKNRRFTSEYENLKKFPVVMVAVDRDRGELQPSGRLQYLATAYYCFISMRFEESMRWLRHVSSTLPFSYEENGFLELIMVTALNSPKAVSLRLFAAILLFHNMIHFQPNMTKFKIIVTLFVYERYIFIQNNLPLKFRILTSGLPASDDSDLNHALVFSPVEELRFQTSDYTSNFYQSSACPPCPYGEQNKRTATNIYQLSQTAI
eukprot:GHVR01109936.1.p1 GENE.GHVR01109936.1~~GHVR01109936.1.p1  ORF type:complete len:282 (-),score=2.30 GHVR01109936.1:111-956(-)